MGGEVFYITEVFHSGRRGETVKFTDENKAKEYAWVISRNAVDYYVEVKVDHDTSIISSKEAMQSPEG